MAGRPDTRAGVDVPAEPPVARHGDVGCPVDDVVVGDDCPVYVDDGVVGDDCPVDAVVVDDGIVAQSCGSEDLFFLGPKQGFLVNGIHPMPCAIADVGVIIAHDHQEVPDLVFRGVEDVVIDCRGHFGGTERCQEQKEGFSVKFRRQREIAESLDSSWRLLRKRRLASRVKKPLFPSGDSGFSRCEC